MTPDSRLRVDTLCLHPLRAALDALTVWQKFALESDRQSACCLPILMMIWNTVPPFALALWDMRPPRALTSSRAMDSPKPKPLKLPRWLSPRKKALKDSLCILWQDSWPRIAHTDTDACAFVDTPSITM